MKRVALLMSLWLLAGLVTAQEKTCKTQFELSYVNTSGNTETQTLSGKVNIEGEKDKNRWQFKTLLLVTSNDGSEKANRLSSELRYERVFTGRLFGFVGMTHLRDRFAGFEHKLAIGPGLGYDVIKGEKQSLKGLVSGTFDWEKYDTAPATSDQFASAKVALKHEWTISETSTLKTGGDYHVSLEDGDKYFITWEAALSLAVNAKISVGISYSGQFQNQTPAPEIKKTDTTLLTSLILTL